MSDAYDYLSEIQIFSSFDMKRLVFLAIVLAATTGM